MNAGKHDAGLPPVEFDEAELLGRADGDPSLLADMIAALLDETPRLQAQVDAALGANDAKAFAAGAHTLKGMFSLFGPNPVSDLAARLEKMGLDGDLKPARVLHTALAPAIDRVTAALRRIQRNH